MILPSQVAERFPENELRRHLRAYPEHQGARGCDVGRRGFGLHRLGDRLGPCLGQAQATRGSEAELAIDTVPLPEKPSIWYYLIRPWRLFG